LESCEDDSLLCSVAHAGLVLVLLILKKKEGRGAKKEEGNRKQET
jgi:hypothetical protein